MDWDNPEERLRLIESVGTDEYNRRLQAYRKSNVIETVNGHAIRPVHCRFGRLLQVGSTGKAFSTIEEARAFANGRSNG